MIIRGDGLSCAVYLGCSVLFHFAKLYKARLCPTLVFLLSSAVAAIAFSLETVKVRVFCDGSFAMHILGGWVLIVLWDIREQ